MNEATFIQMETNAKRTANNRDYSMWKTIKNFDVHVVVSKEGRYYLSLDNHKYDRTRTKEISRAQALIVVNKLYNRGI